MPRKQRAVLEYGVLCKVKCFHCSSRARLHHRRGRQAAESVHGMATARGGAAQRAPRPAGTGKRRPPLPPDLGGWVIQAGRAGQASMRRAAAGKPEAPTRSTSTGAVPRSDPASTAKPLPVGVANSTEVRSIVAGGVVGRGGDGLRPSCGLSVWSVRPSAVQRRWARHIPPVSGRSWFLDFSCRGSSAPLRTRTVHGARTTAPAPTTRGLARPHVLLAASTCTCPGNKKLCAATATPRANKYSKIEDSDLPARIHLPAAAPSSRAPNSAVSFSTFRRSARARDPIIAPSASPVPVPALALALPIAEPDDQTKRHRTP